MLIYGENGFYGFIKDIRRTRGPKVARSRPVRRNDQLGSIVRLHLNSAKPYPIIEHSACQFSSQFTVQERLVGTGERSPKQNQVLMNLIPYYSSHFTGCTLIHRVRGWTNTSINSCVLFTTVKKA